jgi:phage baseplate assembly protein W
MDTLALVQGDLVLASGNYLTFSGVNRITQDLTLALNEAYGGDRNHPYWGSILDRYIGAPLTPDRQQAVLNEVQRVLKNYIAVQTDEINQAALNGDRVNYSTSDVVQSVVSVNAAVQQDRISITVLLQTMSGRTVSITRQVIA